jgi:hypothetical protein
MSSTSSSVDVAAAFMAIDSDGEDVFLSDDDIVDDADSGMRRERETVTYHYSGDILKDIDGTSPDPRTHWSNLPAHKRLQNWMTEFRMPEDVFDELFDMVEPYIPESKAYTTGMRTYSKRHKLLMTVSWLAHIPTLSYMSMKFGSPPSSIAGSILKPTSSASRLCAATTCSTRCGRLPSRR